MRITKVDGVKLVKLDTCELFKDNNCNPEDKKLYIRNRVNEAHKLYKLSKNRKKNKRYKQDNYFPLKYKNTEKTIQQLIKSIENQDLPVNIDDNKIMHLNAKCPEDELKAIITNPERLEKILSLADEYFKPLTFTLEDTDNKYKTIYIETFSTKPKVKTYVKQHCNYGMYYKSHIDGDTGTNFWLNMMYNNAVDTICHFIKKQKKDVIDSRKIIDKDERKKAKGEACQKAVDNYANLTKGYVVSRCKGMIKNYITQKYIQLGKGIYQFYDFEKKELRADDITSMDYEVIKANENITQQLHIALTYAANNISNSVKQLNGQDVLNFDLDSITEFTSDDVRDTARFFGGLSNTSDKLPLNIDTCKAFISYLCNLRNENFHYTKQTSNENELYKNRISKFIDFEKQCYSKNIVKMYNSNNAYRYFKVSNIQNLVNNLYKEIVAPNAYICKFKKIFSVNNKTLFECLNIVEEVKDEEITNRNSCRKFLLKEIYYNEFVRNSDIGKQLIKEISLFDEQFKEQIDDFKQRIKGINDFVKICAKLQSDFVMENSKGKIPSEETKKETKNRANHINIILRQAIQKVFTDYIEEKYSWVIKDNKCYDNATEYVPSQFSTKVTTEFKDLEPFYVLAKFITPKQLSCLSNEFKKYRQFIGTINDKYELYNIKQNVDCYYLDEQATEIIELFTLCQISAGSVSNTLSDYYKLDEETKKPDKNYMNFLNQFLEDKIKVTSALDAKQKLGDTFADEKNFTVLSQVERARMYGFTDKIAKIYPHLYASNIKYIRNHKDIKELSNKDDVNALKKYQSLRNKCELNWLTTFSDVTIDLYSQMISWCYKFERDIIYYLLGTAYIKGNSLQEVKVVYTYSDENRLFKDRLNDYWKSYRDIHKVFKMLFTPQFINLKNKKSYKFGLKNSIDHLHYLRQEKSEQDKKSILDYYFECYHLVDYDIKLKHNVYPKLIKVFDRNKVLTKFHFNKDKSISITPLESATTTFKLENKQEVNDVSIHSVEFCKTLQKLLQYSEEDDKIKTEENSESQKNEKSKEPLLV